MSWRAFAEAFVTLVVIIDPLGSAPILISLTAGRTPGAKRRAALEAAGAAGGLVVMFALFGRPVLDCGRNGANETIRRHAGTCRGAAWDPRGGRCGGDRPHARRPDRAAAATLGDSAPDPGAGAAPGRNRGTVHRRRGQDHRRPLTDQEPRAYRVVRRQHKLVIA